MSHLRIAGDPSALMGSVPRVPDQPNGARGKPLVRVTIGISAPFRLGRDGLGANGSYSDTE
jgi:hypothetical protein